MTHEEVNAIVWMICTSLLIGETARMLVNRFKHA